MSTYFVGSAGIGVREEDRETIEQRRGALAARSEGLLCNIEGIEHKFDRYPDDKKPLMLYYLRGLHLALNKCHEQIFNLE